MIYLTITKNRPYSPPNIDSTMQKESCLAHLPDQILLRKFHRYVLLHSLPFSTNSLFSSTPTISHAGHLPLSHIAIALPSKSQQLQQKSSALHGRDS